MQRNAIVTGGLGGIGCAIAQALRSRGDHVIIFDCIDAGAPAASYMRDQGFVYQQVDVSCPQSVAAAFTAIGSGRIDILVNNAGITCDTIALRMSAEAWDRVLDVNLKGAFLCSQQALKRMIKQSKSYIINVSSIVGRIGNVGQANYVASKAGLIGLTKALALEYASRHVLVNAVAPGFIDTPMTQNLPDEQKQYILQRIPLNRFGTTDDIAAVVAFLSSGNADYMTGQVLEIAGGL